ncbi:MAG TPA: tRNA preQ1(34) S-adenosylmethionine ribosyltransferase-isomerase QueA, partial [Kofleriaceae bacterium]
MWRVADYHYDLPPEQIAQAPCDRRDASRLLHVESDGLADRVFTDIARLLPDGAVLVVNDTRVIPARLAARKPSGGAVEILLLEPVDPARPDGPWTALARASKPIRPGVLLAVAGGASARVVAVNPGGTIAVELDRPPLEVAERSGEVPLPPYIERAPDPADRERYQTVYADAPGAVAAPTAGLHFTPELLAALEARGIARAPVTLHVGLGTFAPVRTDSLRDHRMHRERYTIPDSTAELVASGRPVVAVGTTVVRALEAAARGPHQVAAGPGSTDLFIGPGFGFNVVDHLVTNFHLPGS